MALFGRDGNGTDAYIRASGAGTTASPFITFHDTFTSELKFKAVNLTAAGDVIPAVSGKKIRVMSLILSASQAGSIKFQTDAAADVTGQMYAGANEAIAISNPLGLFDTGTGEKLNAVVTWDATTGTIGLTLGYREV